MKLLFLILPIFLLFQTTYAQNLDKIDSLELLSKELYIFPIKPLKKKPRKSIKLYLTDSSKSDTNMILYLEANYMLSTNYLKWESEKKKSWLTKSSNLDKYKEFQDSLRFEMRKKSEIDFVSFIEEKDFKRKRILDIFIKVCMNEGKFFVFRPKDRKNTKKAFGITLVYDEGLYGKYQLKYQKYNYPNSIHNAYFINEEGEILYRYSFPKGGPIFR